MASKEETFEFLLLPAEGYLFTANSTTAADWETYTAADGMTTPVDLELSWYSA